MTNIRRPSIKQIRSAAEVYFGDHIFEKNRKREVVRIRQLVQYVAHKIYHHSAAMTGKHIGAKDHATVLSSCKTIKNELPQYEYLRDYLRKFTAFCDIKEDPSTPSSIIYGLLKSKTLDVNTKIELRRILKILTDESN